MRVAPVQQKNKPEKISAAGPAAKGKALAAQTKTFSGQLTAASVQQNFLAATVQRARFPEQTSASNEAAPVQLKLPSGIEFNHYIEKKEAQNESVQIIQNWLVLYEVEKEKKHPDIQVLFQRIDYLDKSINLWFDKFKAPDMSKVPNGPFLKHLHEEVAIEHRRLVGFARLNPQQILPVNIEHLDFRQRQQVLRLWNSIVSGSGNISVVGTKEFREQTFADIAKLLQGSYGRTLIDYLDSGTVSTANRTTIDSDFDSTFSKYPKHKQEEGSYAFPRSNLKNDKDTSGEVTQEAQVKPLYPVAGKLKDINDYALAGRPGFTYKGVSYTFGKGSGSLVRIAKEDGSQHLVDKNLNQVLTPTYLTLGHELGHAFRNRAGASLSGAKIDTLDTLLDEQEGDHSNNSKQLWSNSEEILNITTSENSLRKEHGLTKRSYHNSQDSAFKNIFERELGVAMAAFDTSPEAKRILFNLDYWRNNITPALQETKWTKQKLQAVRVHLLHLKNVTIPVASRMYAQWAELFGLQTRYSSVMTLDNFKKIKEVKEVMANLVVGPWTENANAVKIARVRKFLSDKNWWRNFKIGSAAVTLLAASGIGIYLKYFSGNNPSGNGGQGGGNGS